MCLFYASKILGGSICTVKLMLLCNLYNTSYAVYFKK